LDKLRRANEHGRQGPGNREHWQRAIEQDWEQIKQQQAWAASQRARDAEQARLCALFPTAAVNVLRVQLAPTEQLVWIQQALDALLHLHDTETERALLFQAGYISLTAEKLDQALEYAQRLLELAQVAKDDLSLGRAWHLLGSADLARGLLDRAEAYYTRSIPHYEACHAVDEIPTVWRGLGRVAHFRGDYRQARVFAQRYLDSSAALGDDYGVLDAHVALSGSCLAMRDFSAAEQYALGAVALGRAYEHSRLFPPALLSLAHAEKWLGKFDSARTHYEEAIATARTIGSPTTVSNGLYGLGQAHFLEGNYAGALVRLQEALAVARLSQNMIRVCEAALDLVYVYIAQQALDQAWEQLREALVVARGIGTPHFMAKTLAAMVTLWQACGENAQAAVWAGLLKRHSQYLHPSLFDFAVYERLECHLGTARYRQALADGEALTLEGIGHDLSTLDQKPAPCPDSRSSQRGSRFLGRHHSE
jgi:tetratricopeptide (TPR) repeat protein